MAWRWAAAVRLSMCFGFRSSGLVRVVRMCVKTLDCGSAADGYALDFRRLVRDLRIGDDLLGGTLLLIYMEHCCRTFERRREHLLITCLFTVLFSSGCVYTV